MSWKLERLELPSEADMQPRFFEEVERDEHDRERVWRACHSWTLSDVTKALALLYESMTFSKKVGAIGRFRLKHSNGAVIRGDQLP